MKTTKIYLRNGQTLDVNYNSGIDSRLVARVGFLYSPWSGVNQDIEIEETFDNLEELENELQDRFEKEALEDIKELAKAYDFALDILVFEYRVSDNYKNTNYSNDEIIMEEYSNILELIEF